MVNLNKTTVNLTKSQCVNLSKDYEGLDNIHIGLGWDPVERKQPEVKTGFLSRLFGAGKTNSCEHEDIDLDGWAALYGADFRQLGLVYYGDKDYKNKTILHHGDNLTGEGDGDDEVISIRLSKIPAEVKHVLIGITIYAGKSRNQQFKDIKNAFIRLVDLRDGFEICKYEGNDFNGEDRTFYAGVFTREGNDWKFKAVGLSLSTDSICTAVDTAETLLDA